MLGEETLGCDARYTVNITSSCGSTLIQVPQSAITSLRGGAVLDDVSAAMIVVNPCAVDLGRIIVAQHCLSIERNGVNVFHGPITKVEYSEDTTVLRARDPLWWVSRRVHVPGSADQFYDTPIQLAERVVFSRLNRPWTDCTVPFLPACFAEVRKLDGGGLSETPNNTPGTDSELHLAHILKDLADSSLDYTVVGRSLLYGYKAIPIPVDRQQPRPVLTGSSWREAPKIVISTEELLTDAWIQSGNDDRAAPWEPSTSYRATTCCGDFGIHQGIRNLPEISSVTDAVDAGDSLLLPSCDDNGVTTIENLGGSALSDNITWDLPRMVPGMSVDVDVTIQGRRFGGTFVLHEVTFEVSGGDEQVKITLGADR